MEKRKNDEHHLVDGTSIFHLLVPEMRYVFTCVALLITHS